MKETTDIHPDKVEVKENEKGKKYPFYSYTLYPDVEGGYRLGYNVNPPGGGRPVWKPWRLKNADFYESGSFEWKPFQESDPITELEGEKNSADSRFSYPDRNKWGLVVINGSKIWNMKNGLSLQLDETKDIIVNVNDIKGKYADNTGVVKFEIAVDEWPEI